MPLFVKRLTDTALAPTRAHPGDAGLDLYADVDVIVQPHDRMLVSTGIAVSIDPGSAGLIWPRSGMALRYGIDVGAGVIDASYRGEIKVLLFNHDSLPYKISRGDKVAQLLIQSVANPTMTEMDELPNSLRADNGFGSTGV